MTDLRNPGPVEITISTEGTLWVNTLEGCQLRIHGASEIIILDAREWAAAREGKENEVPELNP